MASTPEPTRHVGGVKCLWVCGIKKENFLYSVIAEFAEDHGGLSAEGFKARDILDFGFDTAEDFFNRVSHLVSFEDFAEW